MSDTVFAKETIREAFPKERHGSVFAAQFEAYSFLLKQKLAKEMTLRRVRALWEGKARRVDGEEKDALRRAKIEEAIREHQLLRRRLSELDASLASMGEGASGGSV